MHRLLSTRSILASEENRKLEGCVVVISLVILLPDKSRLLFTEAEHATHQPAFQSLKYLGDIGHSRITSLGIETASKYLGGGHRKR